MTSLSVFDITVETAPLQADWSTRCGFLVWDMVKFGSFTMLFPKLTSVSVHRCNKREVSPNFFEFNPEAPTQYLLSNLE